MASSNISRRIRSSRHKGLIISFEGSEGCGKSTQIRRLAAGLRRQGLVTHVTREPGGTSVGERIRHLLKFSKTNGKMVAEAELLLFSASRAQLVREKILPALRRGEIVLCDRFVDSTSVYQGMARRLDPAFIARLNRFAIAGRKPDLTLVLDLNVRNGLLRARKKTKTADRMEAQRLSFYQAVRRGFRALARKNPGRVKLIDSSRSIHDVAEDIWRQTQRLLTR